MRYLITTYNKVGVKDEYMVVDEEAMFAFIQENVREVEDMEDGEVEDNVVEFKVKFGIHKIGECVIDLS